MKKYIQIILISFAILFLELLLIRLIGSEIRIFAYLSNLVLLAIFLGSGLGMLIKKQLSLRLTAFLLLLISSLAATKLLTPITKLLSPLNEGFFWFQADIVSASGAVLGTVLTVAFFFLLIFTFIPLGQYLGNLFDGTQKIIFTYSLNIFAAIVGMWAFFGLSWISFSPFAGIIVIQILLMFIAPIKKHRRQIAFILILTTMAWLGAKSNDSRLAEKTIWSPYQKLSLIKQTPRTGQKPNYRLLVNNIGYMDLLDLSIEYKKNPELFNLRFQDQYSLPFIFRPDSQKVLIVGAGGGNDAAAALRNGAKEIDAVEIDPQIIKIGNEYHPEQPYYSPLVNVIVEDGRSYFRQTTAKYDLVIMGLADSHTLTSSLTDLRLDHYLYTKESFAEIKNILKPDGILFVSFDVRRPWIGQRIGQAIEQGLGSKPLVLDMQPKDDTPFFGWGGVVFIASRDRQTINKYLNEKPELKDFISQNRIDYPKIQTQLSDNWPYLYLDQPRLPKIHLFISLFLILVFILFNRAAAFKINKFRWDMFFLGAGFLLYEFQNINKTALLFGNTWTTNLFTITAILLLGLLANFLYFKHPTPLKISYIGLIISFLLVIAVPIDKLLFLPFWSRVAAGSIFLNLPLFFSALIFISLFSRAKEKSAAFSANLIGSAFGGILEIFSFLLGINSLLYIAFVLYLLSATMPFLQLKLKATIKNSAII